MKQTFDVEKAATEKMRLSDHSLFGASIYIALIVGSLSLLAFFSRLDIQNALFNAQALTMAVMVLAIMGLEQVNPYKSQWKSGDGGELTDVGYFIVVANMVPKLMSFIFVAGLVSIYDQFNQLRQVEVFWVHDWPVLAQAVLVLLIADPIRYWFHRWGHEVPFLWRFHEVHHSNKKMYWLATMRFHPLERAFWIIPEMLPFLVLGVDAKVVAIYYVFNSVNSLLQHANINMPLGLLNRVVSLQEHHFWHHSKNISESNNNYSSNLIIWDHLFGTHFLPKGRKVKILGLNDESYPKNIFGQLVRPFYSRTTKAIDAQVNQI